MSQFNPFTPNNPVHQDMFVGRITELDAIDKALFQTKHGNPNHILILGERGIGKTSLLNVAAIFAKGDFPWGEQSHNFIVIRISLSDNIGLVDFAKTMKSLLEREFEKQHPDVARLKKAWEFLSRFEIAGTAYRKEELSVQNNAEIVREFIYSLVDTCKSLKETKANSECEKDGLLILIDEADKAAKDLGLGSLLKNLTETLVAENCNHILLILTGLPNARDVLAESHESSLRLFQEFTLKPLSKDETSQVIVNGLTRSEKSSSVQLSIEQEALESIYVFSEGYPHFVQQIGFSVFEVDTDHVIHEEDVNKGVFMEHGALELIGDRYYVKPFYKDIVVESQREILTIMAEKWNDWVTKKEIKKKFTAGDTTLNNGLHALREKGIIIPREGFKGQYRLQWASFAFWIKNHKKTKRRY